MDHCDALIVGGGPAGSACAWKLRRSGLDVLLMDRQKFPRDKVCGGWITPPVLEELEIDPLEYSRERVLQPITGFRTSLYGSPDIATDYGRPVSYGIRRFEFDHYLLERSGARTLVETPLERLERSDDHWTVNGKIRTPLVIGAGGHFCPVARFLGAKVGKEDVVAAQEIEFLMDPRQESECAIDPKVPELYFSDDLKGYSWCFRKQGFLNIGLGRLGAGRLSRHLTAFYNFLKTKKKVSGPIPAPRGHAYLLYGYGPRNLLGEGVMLIGDAAGLAYSRSGEGIRPAVESGLLAARTIVEAAGKYSREALETYPARLAAQLGRGEKTWAASLSRHVPQGLASLLAGSLMATHWFSRHILLDRWFLNSHQPALPPL